MHTHSDGWAAVCRPSHRETAGRWGGGGDRPWVGGRTVVRSQPDPPPSASGRSSHLKSSWGTKPLVDPPSPSPRLRGASGVLAGFYIAIGHPQGTESSDPRSACLDDLAWREGVWVFGSVWVGVIS